MKTAARAIVVLVASCAGSVGFADEETNELIQGPGRDLTLARCIVCHSVDYIEMNAAVHDRNGWQKSIRKMIDRFGAPVTEEEAGVILNYLAANHAIASPPSR